MDEIAAAAATSAEGIVDRPETSLRPARHVKAGDLRPGDIVQQHDWSLHVRKVDVSRAVAEITVAEFGFQLHYAADERVLLAA